MKEPPAASHLAREAHPMTASTLWAVQCGCANYSANIATIENTSPEETCSRAIEEANASDGWKRLDDCGLTFVHALATGDVNNPWSRETYGSGLPVPEQYTKNGKERVPAHGCVAFVERAACHPRSTDRGERGELYRLDPDGRLNLLDALIRKAKAIRHRNKLPSAPAEARPCASSDGPASAPDEDISRKRAALRSEKLPLLVGRLPWELV